MKNTLILFTFLLASMTLFAQDQATAVKSEIISSEINSYNCTNTENDSIQRLSMFLMHEYREAEALRKKGIIVKDIGWVLFAAVPVWVAGDYVRHGGKVCLLTNILAGATFIAGNIMIPTGYVFKGKGTQKMEFLTGQLNQLKYPDAVSIQVAPTLMQSESPQAQEHVGLGISLNIGF